MPWIDRGESNRCHSLDLHSIFNYNHDHCPNIIMF